MNGSWGFNITDDNFKSTPDLIRYLVRAAGHNANFLLNVGPMPNGEIQPEFVQRLEEIGAWTKQYGESIYGTRGGPITPGSWGVTTQRGNIVYVHLLDWTGESIALPDVHRKVLSAHRLLGGSQVTFTVNDYGLLLKLPRRTEGRIDEVIVLTTGS
jgi:alpha-L-fucosidase